MSLRDQLFFRLHHTLGFNYFHKQSVNVADKTVHLFRIRQTAIINIFKYFAKKSFNILSLVIFRVLLFSFSFLGGYLDYFALFFVI